ncbi:MAG: hypothetical protein ACRDFW_03685 [bacterium]
MPPREDARFQPLLAWAKSHWREHLPRYVRLLEKDGELEAALERAVEQTILVLNQAEARGLNPDQARELAYPNILLPPEDEM